MDVGSAVEAVAALRGAVDLLLAADLTAPPGPALAELFAAVEVERRRLEAVDHTMIARLDECRVAGDFGRSSTRELLVDLTHMAPGEATARVRAAADLGPRHEITGAPLEPLFARVAEAQCSGDISAAHAREIRRCIDNIPDHLAVEASGSAEEFLVAQARLLDPRLLAHVGERLLATIDPDGAEPRDADQQRHCGLDVRQDGQGGWTVHGRLTGDCAAVFLAALDPLSAPQPSDDGIGDDRAPTQRRHDALLDLSRRTLRSGTLPESGGTPTTVLAGIPLDDLLARTGTASTDCGGNLSTAALLALADECELIITVFDRMGAVLCAGRDRRVASPAQRRVLAARDGGCSFPGCTRPPSWAQAHHVIAWIDGGRTDIDNLASC